MAQEAHEQLSAALASLTVEDRLLVRLHFERGLTLCKLAEMFALPNPQAAHRRLREIFVRLQDALGGAVKPDARVRKEDNRGRQ
jgi:DNA-directed RNA polymerase specialized sigma24 family protein